MILNIINISIELIVIIFIIVAVVAVDIHSSPAVAAIQFHCYFQPISVSVNPVTNSKCLNSLVFKCPIVQIQTEFRE